jgi:methanogenic corrinoid protein MtbC1
MSRREADDNLEACLSGWAAMTRSRRELAEDGSNEQLMQLSRAIEGEIIPRLMMLFDEGTAAEASDLDADAATPITPNDIAEFARLLLEQDAEVASQHVENMRSRGIPLPRIYLDLLAPAARHLGELWELDDCSFTEVTIGVTRMHQLLMKFSPCFSPRRAEDGDAGHSALLFCLPGEQHTFGLLMVGEFFRRNGWNVCSGTPANDRELHDLLAGNRFDLVGCSVSSDRHLDELSSRIRTIREHSLNTDVKIMVGGRAFHDQPSLAQSLGADLVARHGDEAVRIAESVLGDS